MALWKTVSVFALFVSKGDIMHRCLTFVALGMLLIISPVACTRTDQAELAKARAEIEAAKAETTAAKAESAKIRSNAVMEAKRRGQDLEVTDTKGNVIRIKDAFLRYTGPTYVVTGTQYSENHDAIQVTTGAAHLNVPWQEVYAVVLLPYRAEEPVRVVLKNGEVMKGRLDIASLVGKTEAGLEVSFVTDAGYICKILNRDKLPAAAAAQSVAELEVTIAKMQKHFGNGGIARFPDAKEKRFTGVSQVVFTLRDGSTMEFERYDTNRIEFNGMPGKMARVTKTDGADQTIEFKDVSFSVDWMDGSHKQFGLYDVDEGLTFTAESR